MPGMRRPEAESGFTLVELLVVMLLLGVVGGVTIAGLVTGMQQSQRAQDRVSAMAELQRTAENVARELRAACPLVVAEDDRAELVVTRNGALVEHRYYVNADGDELRHEIDEDEPADARTIVHGLAMDGAAVFEYRANDNKTADTAQEVRWIRLTLRREPGWSDDPIEVATAVQLRNGGRSCE